jgi:tetratricopeptide (TPR) repeat protein
MFPNAAHWHVALSLTTLGSLLRQTGDSATARPLLERAVAIATATWQAHPDLWWSQRTLAGVLIDLGEFDAALELLEPQRALFEQRGETEWLAEVLRLLGEAAAAGGDRELARQRFGAAREAMQALWGPDDPDVRELDAVLRELESGRDLLFEVVSRRHEKAPIVLTTNKPFAEWNEVFPNSSCVTALVDRLVHKAEIIAIEGDSYRAKEAKDRTSRRASARRSKRTRTGKVKGAAS